MKLDAKIRANQLFHDHLHMIANSQTEFRRAVMQALIDEGIVTTVAAAATHYNNAKKAAERSGHVTGLGRTQATASSDKKSSKDILISDDECFTVLEILDNVVVRTESFAAEEPARKKYKERLSGRIPAVWKLITGLGPNVGDTYRLLDGESELV